MSRKQFFILALLVLIIGGAGIAMFQRDSESWKGPDERLGQRVLPNLQVRYEPRDDLVLRAAYSRTLGRPTFGQLKITGTLTATPLDNGQFDGELSEGNVDLKPYVSDNLDATAEWYFAQGGLLYFGPGVQNADIFVLSLPLAAGQQGLALAAFVGGLSAATGMVIVEAIAVSTMVCNDLVMPLLLRLRPVSHSADVASLLLGIRRAAIVVVLLRVIQGRRPI